jgi:hypothetical protein
MSLGIVFLVGTLGFLADVSYSYYLNHVAPESAPSVTHSNVGGCRASGICDIAYTQTVELSEPRPARTHWAMEWSQKSFALLSGMGTRVMSFSAVWLVAVGAAALCMFTTRPS